ncbi:MAG: TlpA disulfide reductase family protein [Geminicoccaceae bacterium]
MRYWIAPLAAIAVFMSTIAGPAIGKTTLEALLTDLPVLRGASPAEGDLDDRVVLVAFFASWCPPCKHEFPHLNTVQQAYREAGLRVVAINVFETFDGLSTPAKLELFLDDVDPVFPILKGDTETRRVFGNLDRIPTMFLFARDGDLDFVFRHEQNAEKTHLSEAELRAAIEPLL